MEAGQLSQEQMDSTSFEITSVPEVDISAEIRRMSKVGYVK